MRLLQIGGSIVLSQSKDDSDKLVSCFVQTPPSKNRPFYNWLICFVIIQNDVLYLGGVCMPVYLSLQSSLVKVILFGKHVLHRLSSLKRWFSTLQARRPTKDKNEHFGGPP